MGSSDDDNQTRKQLNHHNQTKNKLKIFVIIILTNLLTIYIFAGPSIKIHPIPKIAWDYNSLLHELNTTQHQLSTSQLTVERLLTDIKQLNEIINQTSGPEKFNYDELRADLSNEAKLAIGPHKLPLGYSQRMDSDEVYPPVGGGCLRFKDEIEKYMKYEVGGECPVDDVFAQKMLMKGCEPLPRRRCRPKSPVGYVEPFPLPESLWTTPPDTSIIWDPYTCKSYGCLIGRKSLPGFYDCKDCFDLQYREKSRWLFDHGGIDYGMDQVLGTKPHGTIRIGLDIGGGTATFAARMKERNVTIITTSMNLDGPFNSFIASRGLLPMHFSVFQRLPFFENTLDIVHSMHILSNWIPDMMLEFTLYDIYRVLRPGGLFWLDHFFCYGSQLNATYAPMLDRVGFNKLRWNTAAKLDRGVDKNEWYISALLEKPMT